MRHLRLSVFVVAGLLLPAVVDAQPFAVGHRSITYVDPSRNNRQIPTELYYPADAAGNDVLVAAGAYPVITFGHGFLMVWSAYQYLWLDLVPHGYILALPRTEGSLFPSHERFGGDLAFLVDKLQAEGTTPTSPFYGHIAPTSCVMGHSMGGGASVLAAAANPRITALANLAAAETNPSAIAAAAGVTVPALLFAGSNDCVTPPSQHQVPIYNALAPTCKALVTITGGTHCQFADTNFNCELGESCTGTITREEQHMMIEAYLEPWLAWTLQGDTAAFWTYEDLLRHGSGVTTVQDCAVITNVAAQPATRLAARAYPNPFRGTTRIRFALEDAAGVRVDVFDVSGRRIRNLFDDWVASGSHDIDWDGRSDSGDGLPAGIYFCRIRTDRELATRALLLLR